MKNSRRQLRPDAAPPPPAPPPSKPRAGWRWWAFAAAALAVFGAYSPALRGPFLFDDNMLPFAIGNVASAPLRVWLSGSRPALMFTYWINARISGDDTFSYHALNVAIHCFTAWLVYLIVRRLLERAGVAGPRRGLLAGFAAAVFLLHPIQTEAVAYLAGRSECLSVMLAFAAFAIFLYRRKTEASWGVVFAVLILFGAALLAKEHTIALPALLLLTDYWWNPGFSFRGACAELEAVRRSGRRRRRRAGHVLGPHLPRHLGRIRPQGFHLVSIFLHPVPRPFRVRRRVRAAGAAHGRLGFSDLKDHSRPRGHLRAHRAGGAGGGRLAFPPPLSAGFLRFLRVPDPDGSHLLNSAHCGSCGRAADLLFDDRPAADPAGAAEPGRCESQGAGGDIRGRGSGGRRGHLRARRGVGRPHAALAGYRAQVSRQGSRP